MHHIDPGACEDTRGRCGNQAVEQNSPCVPCCVDTRSHVGGTWVMGQENT